MFFGLIVRAEPIYIIPALRRGPHVRPSDKKPADKKPPVTGDQEFWSEIPELPRVPEKNSGTTS